MSKSGRAAHERNTARHAQRNGFEKPKPQPVGSDTLWMSEFVSSIQGITTPFNADSLITLQLGEDRDERILKLRKMAKLGILHMYAHRSNGEFVEYRWELTPRGGQ
jgi:hypothetical protein